MKQSASSAKAFIAFHNDRWWRELKVDGKKKQKKKIFQHVCPLEKINPVTLTKDRGVISTLSLWQGA